MKRGMYSYRDFDQEKHYLYALGLSEDGLMIIGYDGAVVAWLHQYGLDYLLPSLEEGEILVQQIHHSHTFAPFTLSKHLPYLTYLPTWHADDLAPSNYQDFPLSLENYHEAGQLQRLFYRFYSRHWWGRLPVEKRLPEMVKSFKGLVSEKTMGRVARYLFNKHVNDENRLTLLLHAGIYPYLIEANRNEEDK